MTVLSSLRGSTPNNDSLSDIVTAAKKMRRRSLVYAHSGEIPDLDPPDPAVDVDFASEQLINEVVTPEKRRQKFLQFLDDGYVGFIAHDGETLVARGWVCTPAATSVPYHLPAWIADVNGYWLTHARTQEAYRNRGWHKYIVAQRLQWIREKAEDGPVYTDTAPESVSRDTFTSTGFDACGTMTTYRIGHPSIGVKQFGNWDPEARHPPLPHTREN